MTSGWSALILCIILGKRLGFGKENFTPHSMVLCMIGTGMLWVGWYGFNAGSAVAADVIAANAFTTTTLATAVASFVWPMLEWIVRGKPSVLGFCSGAVAGPGGHHAGLRFCHCLAGAVIIGICRRHDSVVLLLTRSKAGSAMTTRWTPWRSRASAEPAARSDRHPRPQGRQRQPGHQPCKICRQILPAAIAWFLSNSRPSALRCSWPLSARL